MGHKNQPFQKRSISISRIVGGVILLLGLGTPCYQAIMWLKDGAWISISLMDVLGFILASDNSFWVWLHQPTFLHGVNHIVVGAIEYIPFSLFLIVIAFGVMRLEDRSGAN